MFHRTCFGNEGGEGESRVGASLVNLFVRSEDPDAVAEAITPILRPAYLKANTRSEVDADDIVLFVAPSIRGWVGVFDLLMETRNQALCEWVVRKLSGAMNAVTLSFLVHDGDYVRYWLGQGGRLIDRYHSSPDYYGTVSPAEIKRLQGRPSLLADLCGKPLEALSIARILRDPDWDGLAEEQLKELNACLEIPNLVSSYNTVEQEAQEGFVEGFDEFRAITLTELLGL